MLNNVPLTGQSLNVTRVPVNSNFSTIDTAFSVNHIQYNDGSGNQGMHYFVQMPIPASTPTTGTSQVGLYAQTSTYTSQPELVFSHQSGSTAPTSAQIVEFTSAGWSNTGWARMPSGILFKWGLVNIGGLPSGTTITFPVGATIPAFAAVYNVQITQGYNSTSTANNTMPAVSYSTPPSATGFTLTWSGGSYNSSTSVYYFAIGV